MERNKLYISTVASDAAQMAREYGIGIEIAEYCTAWNMDEAFAQTDAAVKEKLAGIGKRVLHGPFNELFPCAIDPKARQLAADRYRQAVALAKQYGADQVILHAGYNPWLYYRPWFVEQSVAFWSDFLREDPGVRIVLENVLETDPAWLAEILNAVGDQRLGMCLDIGHVNAYSPEPIEKWLKVCSPWIRHLHIHNNDGRTDLHSSLGEGSIPMKAVLQAAEDLCPQATFCLEVTEGRPSLRWLCENQLI